MEGEPSLSREDAFEGERVRESPPFSREGKGELPIEREVSADNGPALTGGAFLQR
jgi:hypothetical protein